MTEDEALVWYEADGTRHELGEPPATVEAAEPVRHAPPQAGAPKVEHAEPAVPEPRAVPAQPTGSEPLRAAPAVAEPGATAETAASDTVEKPKADDPSALSGMVRALLLGAAAAAATGAVVGAISLASTGDRPDTTEATIVPVTLGTEAVSAGSQPPPSNAVETIELPPPTTSADQPD